MAFTRYKSALMFLIRKYDNAACLLTNCRLKGGIGKKPNSQCQIDIFLEINTSNFAIFLWSNTTMTNNRHASNWSSKIYILNCCA